MTDKARQKPSFKAQALSARLSAVQATYQMTFNKQPIKMVAREYMEERAGMEINGEALVRPDSARFKAILYGVDERMLELEPIIQAHLQHGDGQEEKIVEPLLRAILLCGTYELLACQDIDSPIIINDYLHVTHSFYSKSEAGLVNGILDSIAKLLRGA